jgi:hypothetical protein
MEIKRNIFESSARMPQRYENVASKMPDPGPVDYGRESHENHVVHARSPRVGEK